MPVGILAVVLAFVFLPADLGKRRRESLDPVGVVLLATGVFVLLLPLVEEQTWKGSAKWLLLPLAAAILAVFAGWERRFAARGREPMIDVTLFRQRSYALGTCIGLVYFVGFTAIFFVYTLFLQSGRHFSALEAGLASTPFAIGAAAAAALGGRKVSQVGRPLIAAGLALVALGVGVTAVVVGAVDGKAVGVAAALPLLVAGIGSGLVISPNITLSLADVPVQRAGSAGGVLQTAQRIGSAIGIAAVGSLFFSRLSSTRGDYTSALPPALWLCFGVVVLALLLAVLDLRRGRSRGRHERH